MEAEHLRAEKPIDWVSPTRLVDPFLRRRAHPKTSSTSKDTTNEIVGLVVQRVLDGVQAMFSTANRHLVVLPVGNHFRNNHGTSHFICQPTMLLVSLLGVNRDATARKVRTRARAEPLLGRRVDHHKKNLMNSAADTAVRCFLRLVDACHSDLIERAIFTMQMVLTLLTNSNLVWISLSPSLSLFFSTD